MRKLKDFLVIDNSESEVVFSTAAQERSFNRHTEEGIVALESIKDTFNVDDVIYINQIHSDIVHIYNGEENFKNLEGDAIVTNVKNVAVGAFTADCVPVILVNEKDGVIAAIHSGWKGTFSSITAKTLKVMEDKFKCDNRNTKAYIGPHIMQCCYEVSEELKDKFIKQKSKVNNLFEGRNLNMQECILEDLKKNMIKEENIYLINECTYCSKNIELHSYRKSEGSYGRLFTFGILK